jgi:hypothetical protein
MGMTDTEQCPGFKQVNFEQQVRIVVSSKIRRVGLASREMERELCHRFTFRQDGANAKMKFAD